MDIDINKKDDCTDDNNDNIIKLERSLLHLFNAFKKERYPSYRRYLIGIAKIACSDLRRGYSYVWS